MFPRTATQVFSARARAYSQALVTEWGCGRLNGKIMDQFGNKVLHGPFSDVLLSPETCREHLAPFLLGTYESELHEVWNSVFGMKFSQILDVGAKFGYYAIGLARRFPGIPVLAFDTDPWARRATREMSSANDVQIQVLGFCTPDWMRSNLRKGAFVFSDCEGYESTLFGSVEIPNLSFATMLIEIHEHASPGVARLIHNKYFRSHEIVTIPTRAQNVDFPPELASLSEVERKMAVTEYRTGEQAWMFLKPRALGR
jgi:hypothetical protein